MKTVFFDLGDERCRTPEEIEDVLYMLPWTARPGS
jgi:hypothetical protein